MDYAKFIEENIHIIDQAIKCICRRYNLSVEEAEEFAAEVRYKLVENDYKIIRQFKGKSSIKSYLDVVITNLFIDKKRAAQGRWRASEEAKRRGKVAIKLDELLYKDSYSLEEAYRILRINYNVTLSEEELDRIFHEIDKERTPRIKEVCEDVEIMSAIPDQRMRPDEEVEKRRLEKTAEKLFSLVDGFSGTLSEIDRLVLRMFQDNHPISEIARCLGISRSNIEKRLKGILHEFRKKILASEGVNQNDINEIIDGLEDREIPVQKKLKFVRLND
jgi:RNA polymerase sigma factor (sigma-70 family)